MSELKIVAKIILKEEFRKEIETVLHTVVDGTRKEEGNVSYDLHQDVKNPLEYTLIEVWKSQDAIDLHNETAHFKAFVAAIQGKIDGLEISVIKKVY